ncbi:PaaI family thioesterase [Chenggangzhangella methanolivorans]|nr:PaaI family thioesterase [Chenggangzhangella methanolivorans]
MTQKPRLAEDRAPRLSLDEVNAFLAREFPQMQEGGPTYEIETIGYGEARMRLLVSERHLRPGGTVSGPAMMALADVALYVALLGAIGPVKLAVTTSLNINFLRRPALADVVAECRYLKIGRTLAVGEAELTSAGSDDVIAHVTATYSIPPKG